MFGRLTILEEAGRTKKQSVLWLCQCECGKKIKTTSTALVRGTTKSCSCYRYDQCSKAVKSNLKSGDMYGRLKIIREIGRTKAGKVKIDCECQCPAKTKCVKIASHLIGGRDISCGCVGIEKKSEQVLLKVKKILGKTFGKLRGFAQK